jgi:hypothetical protein
MEVSNNMKFIVQENNVDVYFKHFVLLCDVVYWNKNYEDLMNWCYYNDSELLGMTVNIPDDKRLFLFILRWS